MGEAEFPSLAELVPHRGEVLLIDRVLAHDGERTRVLLRVGSPSWLLRADGTVPAWLALEYMAQCVAAHEGLLARALGRPPPEGFLVAALGLRLGRRHFTAGEELGVCAERARGRPGLGALSYQCSLYAADAAREEAPLAEGRLSISLPGPSPVTPRPRGRSGATRAAPGSGRAQSTASKPSKRG